MILSLFSGQIGIGSIILLLALGGFWFQYRGDRRSAQTHALTSLKEDNIALKDDVQEFKEEQLVLNGEITKLRARTNIERIEQLTVEGFKLINDQLEQIATRQAQSDKHHERMTHILDRIDKRSA